jgi:hypothetical protein
VYFILQNKIITELIKKKLLLIYYIISCPEGFIIVRQLQNVRQNFYYRLGQCLAAYGRQFEQFMK